MPEKMDKHQLDALLSELSNETVGHAGSELSKQRADSMQFYLGEPFGNEVNGKSETQGDMIRIIKEKAQHEENSFNPDC